MLKRAKARAPERGVHAASTQLSFSLLRLCLDDLRQLRRGRIDQNRQLRRRGNEQSQNFRAQNVEARQIRQRDDSSFFQTRIVQEAELDFQLVEFRREIFQRL